MAPRCRAEIPRVGDYGIPLRDEIELAKHVDEGLPTESAD
jgi:hypothetical protein